MADTASGKIQCLQFEDAHGSMIHDEGVVVTSPPPTCDNEDQNLKVNQEVLPANTQLGNSSTAVIVSPENADACYEFDNTTPEITSPPSFPSEDVHVMPLPSEGVLIDFSQSTTERKQTSTNPFLSGFENIMEPKPDTEESSYVKYSKISECFTSSEEKADNEQNNPFEELTAYSTNPFHEIHTKEVNVPNPFLATDYSVEKEIQNVRKHEKNIATNEDGKLEISQKFGDNLNKEISKDLNQDLILQQSNRNLNEENLPSGSAKEKTLSAVEQKCDHLVEQHQAEKPNPAVDFPENFKKEKALIDEQKHLSETSLFQDFLSHPVTGASKDDKNENQSDAFVQDLIYETCVYAYQEEIQNMQTNDSKVSDDSCQKENQQTIPIITDVAKVVIEPTSEDLVVNDNQKLSQFSSSHNNRPTADCAANNLGLLSLDNILLEDQHLTEVSKRQNMHSTENSEDFPEVVSNASVIRLSELCVEDVTKKSLIQYHLLHEVEDATLNHNNIKLESDKSLSKCYEIENTPDQKTIISSSSDDYKLKSKLSTESKMSVQNEFQGKESITPGMSYNHLKEKSIGILGIEQKHAKEIKPDEVQIERDFKTGIFSEVLEEKKQDKDILLEKTENEAYGISENNMETSSSAAYHPQQKDDSGPKSCLEKDIIQTDLKEKVEKTESKKTFSSGLLAPVEMKICTGNAEQNKMEKHAAKAEESREINNENKRSENNDIYQPKQVIQQSEPTQAKTIANNVQIVENKSFSGKHDASENWSFDEKQTQTTTVREIEKPATKATSENVAVAGIFIKNTKQNESKNTEKQFEFTRFEEDKKKLETHTNSIKIPLKTNVDLLSSNADGLSKNVDNVDQSKQVENVEKMENVTSVVAKPFILETLLENMPVTIKDRQVEESKSTKNIQKNIGDKTQKSTKDKKDISEKENFMENGDRVERFEDNQNKKKTALNMIESPITEETKMSGSGNKIEVSDHENLRQDVKQVKNEHKAESVACNVSKQNEAIKPLCEIMQVLKEKVVTENGTAKEDKQVENEYKTKAKIGIITENKEKTKNIAKVLDNTDIAENIPRDENNYKTKNETAVIDKYVEKESCGGNEKILKNDCLEYTVPMVDESGTKLENNVIKETKSQCIMLGDVKKESVSLDIVERDKIKHVKDEQKIENISLNKVKIVAEVTGTKTMESESEHIFNEAEKQTLPSKVDKKSKPECGSKLLPMKIAATPIQKKPNAYSKDMQNSRKSETVRVTTIKENYSNVQEMYRNIPKKKSLPIGKNESNTFQNQQETIRSIDMVPKQREIPILSKPTCDSAKANTRSFKSVVSPDPKSSASPARPKTAPIQTRKDAATKSYVEEDKNAIKSTQEVKRNSPRKSPSLTGSPARQISPRKTPDSVAASKNIRSKIRSLANAHHVPGGGNVKIINKKETYEKVQSKIRSKDNIQHKPGGGNIKIETKHLHFTETAKPKVGSMDKADYKPGGGEKKIENHKLNWKNESKIGSKDNIKHKAGGGEKKIESSKLEWKAESKIGSKDNVQHKAGGGEKKIESHKLEWKAESKIGSKDNAQHKAIGGEKKVESHKLDWKAESKIGSRENAQHRAGGGEKKIEDHKLDWKAESKIGSKDNAQHKPGGGEKKIESQKLEFKEKAEHRIYCKDKPEPDGAAE